MMSDAVSFVVSVSVAARAAVVRTPVLRVLRAVATVAVRAAVVRAGAVAVRVFTPWGAIAVGAVVRD